MLLVHCHPAWVGSSIGHRVGWSACGHAQAACVHAQSACVHAQSAYPPSQGAYPPVERVCTALERVGAPKTAKSSEKSWEVALRSEKVLESSAQE